MRRGCESVMPRSVFFLAGPYDAWAWQSFAAFALVYHYIYHPFDTVTIGPNNHDDEDNRRASHRMTELHK